MSPEKLANCPIMRLKDLNFIGIGKGGLEILSTRDRAFINNEMRFFFFLLPNKLPVFSLLVDFC